MATLQTREKILEAELKEGKQQLETASIELASLRSECEQLRGCVLEYSTLLKKEAETMSQEAGQHDTDLSSMKEEVSEVRESIRIAAGVHDEESEELADSELRVGELQSDVEQLLQKKAAILKQLQAHEEEKEGLREREKEMMMVEYEGLVAENAELRQELVTVGDMAEQQEEEMEGVLERVNQEEERREEMVQQLQQQYQQQLENEVSLHYM